MDNKTLEFEKQQVNTDNEIISTASSKFDQRDYKWVTLLTDDVSTNIGTGWYQQNQVTNNDGPAYSLRSQKTRLRRADILDLRVDVYCRKKSLNTHRISSSVEVIGVGRQELHIKCVERTPHEWVTDGIF